MDNSLEQHRISIGTYLKSGWLKANKGKRLTDAPTNSMRKQPVQLRSYLLMLFLIFTSLWSNASYPMAKYLVNVTNCESSIKNSFGL